MASDPIKSRDLPFEDKVPFHDELWYKGQLLSQTNTVSSITGRQTTMSWDNSDWHTRRKLDRLAREGKLHPASRRAYDVVTKQDQGAPFHTTTHIYEDNHDVISTRHANGDWLYIQSGPWYAKTASVGPTGSQWPVINDVDMQNDMIGLGTTAIARSIPTNPAAGVAQFLGEMKERLPSVPGAALARRGGDPKAIADEYLNYEFGISPFIKDIREIGRAVQDTEKRLAQLRRDSGRLVRRRYQFPVDRKVSDPVVESTSFYGAPSRRTGGTGAYVTGGKLTKTVTEVTETWFSGGFTYLYQEGDSTLDRLRRAEQGANAVLGLRLTPELIWQLTPWSWAVDWVSNLGDVLHNLSAFTRDGLVMRYGYVMQTKRITHTYHLGNLNWNSGLQGASTTQSFTTVKKKRLKATPYGFGLDTGAFTARQWAILGALGISRTHGKL
jgi:hypothetical protein